MATIPLELTQEREPLRRALIDVLGVTTIRASDVSVTTRHKRSAVLPGWILKEYGSQVAAAASGRVELLGDDELRLMVNHPEKIEIVVTGIDEAVFKQVLAASDLRWVHSMSAGVEHLPLETMAEHGVLLTNSSGAYAPAMAEFALAAMIMLARHLPSWLDGQKQRLWIEPGSFIGAVLRGKRLGIVGYGAVGRELATAAKALGMEVWATRRTPLFASAEALDRLLPAQELPKLLASSDFVVLTASLNQTTRHLIGEAEFAVMKPTAVLVNVARGGLVDEVALVGVLKAGRLRAAMLDVTSLEPLPSESELWTVPNLYITPHISGNTPESWRSAVEFFCRNLELYLAGRPERMGNLVDYSAVL